MRKSFVFLVTSGLILIVVACWAAANTGFLFAGVAPAVFIPPAASVAFSVSAILFVIALAITIDDIVTTRSRPAESPAPDPLAENELSGDGGAGPDSRGSGRERFPLASGFGMRALLATLLVAAAMATAMAAYGMSAGFAVSVVPGWHTAILAPYAVVALVVIVVLLAVALATVFMHFASASDARAP
ncbi:MAG TPA: hypothetical protein VFJ16_10435 [Longimicrobium sp.]|nr:hypothetical protein [Longimicrobium sp.]